MAKFAFIDQNDFSSSANSLLASLSRSLHCRFANPSVCKSGSFKTGSFNQGGRETEFKYNKAFYYYKQFDIKDEKEK